MIGAALRRFLGRAPEQRAVDWLPPAFLGAPTASGKAVNPRTAESLAAVQACISVIAGSIATLPAYVRRQDGSAWIEAPEHPASRLIQAPNQWQPWPEFIESLLASTLLHGNGLARVDVDAAGQPVALVFHPWGNVAPLLLPSGNLAFDATQVTAIAGGAGQTRRLLADEVLLLRDRSDDGLLGRSRISRSADAIGNALGLAEQSGAMFRNAATPSGILAFPPGTTGDSLKRARAHFEGRHVGAANAGQVFYADAGTTFTPIQGQSAVDAEVLASRRFAVEEVCRIFGVPPPMIGDLQFGTFTNAETAGRWFATHTLRPWVARLEAAFQTVFAPADRGRYRLEIDMSGLLRGSETERWQSYAIARAQGILTVDEIREAEGYNPLPAGQQPAPVADPAPIPPPAAG